MLVYTVFNAGRPLVYKINTGSKGDAATVRIGEVSTGTFPKVENVGTPSDAILNFTIPVSEGGGSIAVDSELSEVSINPVQNKILTKEILSKAEIDHTHRKSDITDFPTLATVAISGDYRDLDNKPAGLEVDNELSVDSPNPVENAVIATKFNSVQNKIDNKANLLHTHTKNQIIDFPISMPASDVSAWAKAPLKPTYNANEVSGLANVARTGSYNDLTDKPDIGSVVSDDFLSTTSTNPVQNKVITNRINQLDTGITNLTTQVNLKANQSALTSLDSSLSTVAKSGKYEDLTGLPTLSEVASTGMYEDLIDAPVLATVATTGQYSDLIGKIEKATDIASGENGYVSGDQVFNYVTSMSLSTAEEVQAIIDEATATYSETLLNTQIDEINGEVV